MLLKKRTSADRRGASTVEFAIVAPIMLALIFLIIELSRMMLFSGNVNTAMLIGLRSLTLRDATPTDVENEIRTELGRFGISAATITFDPANFDENVDEVVLSVDAPANRANGLHLSRLTFGGSRSVYKTVTVDRETR